jgi:hypothetical protein
VPALELAIDDVSARIVLWRHLAPKAVEALLASLPIETPLHHCKWSGEACFAEIASGPLTALADLECPVTSIYPGTLVVRPPDAATSNAELLIAYGDAEYRWPTSRMYVTPVGRLADDGGRLFTVLSEMASSGDRRVRLAPEMGAFR